MTDSLLPKIGEKAPRKKAVQKKAKVGKAASQQARDIIKDDIAARSNLAREAALRAAEKLNEATPEEPQVTAEQTIDGAPVVTLAPASPAPAPMDRNQLIVNQDLVELLKSVKTTSLGDFEKFLHELHPLMELWSNALSEAAARRHALAIMLLIKEHF